MACLSMLAGAFPLAQEKIEKQQKTSKEKHNKQANKHTVEVGCGVQNFGSFIGVRLSRWL